MLKNVEPKPEICQNLILALTCPKTLLRNCMELKTKKLIAREILFFVKMLVPTAIIVFFGAVLFDAVSNDFGAIVMTVGGLIYPFALLVRLFNWAKETVNKDE